MRGLGFAAGLVIHSIRPLPEDVIAWARETGMLIVEEPACVLPPWHFGVTLRRTGD